MGNSKRCLEQSARKCGECTIGSVAKISVEENLSRAAGIGTLNTASRLFRGSHTAILNTAERLSINLRHQKEEGRRGEGDVPRDLCSFQGQPTLCRWTLQNPLVRQYIDRPHRRLDMISPLTEMPNPPRQACLRPIQLGIVERVLRIRWTLTWHVRVRCSWQETTIYLSYLTVMHAKLMRESTWTWNGRGTTQSGEMAASISLDMPHAVSVWWGYARVALMVIHYPRRYQVVPELAA